MRLALDIGSFDSLDCGIKHLSIASNNWDSMKAQSIIKSLID